MITLSHQMTLIDAMSIVIILLAATAVNMLWSELRTHRMNARVHHAVAEAIPTRVRFGGVIGLMQRFGQWLRRFYAPDNLEHLRGIARASGIRTGACHCSWPSSFWLLWRLWSP